MKYRVGEGHDGAMAVEARISAIANSVHNLIRGKHEKNKTMDHCITNAKTNAETYDQSNSGKIHN